MSLSPDIKASLTENAESFIKIIPVRELLIPLRFKGVLSSRQVEEMKHLYITEDMNDYLLNILLDQREDQDFDTFCHILEENSVNAVKQFAAKLLSDANRNHANGMLVLAVIQ